MLLCRQCRSEADFHYSVPCVCGHTKFSFRPITGETSPWSGRVYIQCKKCGRYQTPENILKVSKPYDIAARFGIILGIVVGIILWFFLPLSEISGGAHLAIPIVSGIVVVGLVTFIGGKIIKNFIRKNTNDIMT